MSDQHPSGDSASADWALLAGAPATAESLTALTGADPSAMTGAALVDAIVASEKALSLLAGTQMRLLAALAVPFVAGDPMRLAAGLARKRCITGDDDPDQVAHYIPEAAASLAEAEVAAALRIPCRTAGIRVTDADRMTGARVVPADDDHLGRSGEVAPVASSSGGASLTAIPATPPPVVHEHEFTSEAGCGAVPPSRGASRKGPATTRAR